MLSKYINMNFKLCLVALKPLVLQQTYQHGSNAGGHAQVLATHLTPLAVTSNPITEPVSTHKIKFKTKHIHYL